MRVALDTDRLIDLLRGGAGLADRLAACEAVWVSLIVLEKTRAGVQLKRAIAALALEHELVLIARDRHFAFIPQLLQE